MSGFKDIAKNGWHPKGKDGGRESWRGDNKGINTVAGWMGKGKSSSATEAAYQHQSAPLSSLKDPASFAPPPKHVKYHGAAAASTNSSSLGTPVAALAAHPTQQGHDRAAQEEGSKAPPVPFRADTTGLNTAHLPKPPAFRPTPPVSPSVTTTAKPKPMLPPRLPPRQNEYPDEHTPPAPPPYSKTEPDAAASYGQLSPEATNRLGAAGISVPGLEIGRHASPPVPPRQKSTPVPTSPDADANRGPQLSELQSRFARMSTSSAEAPASGTTWREKQAALKVASNLRDDPSKVSLSDAKSAASTANNFRQRNGEQAAAGMRAVSGLSQKYEIADRINGLRSSSTTPQPPQSPPQTGFSKKPPPPPPPKKKEFTGEPPPIPLGSKPKFGP